MDWEQKEVLNKTLGFGYTGLCPSLPIHHSDKIQAGEIFGGDFPTPGNPKAPTSSRTP